MALILGFLLAFALGVIVGINIKKKSINILDFMTIIFWQGLLDYLQFLIKRNPE